MACIIGSFRLVLVYISSKPELRGPRRYHGLVIPIPVALVGYGIGGSIFHAPFIRSVPRLRLEMVVTSRGQQVAALAGPESAPRAVTRVDEALADPGIKLVAVVTPSDTHFEVARRALLAGKHVVVDKPFALNVAEAEELMALAQRNGCLLSVYQSRRWDGDFLTVERAIREGSLGTVYHYEAHFDRFRPKVRDVWREQAGKGSGILYDLGSHLIDQALVLFGMPQRGDGRRVPAAPGGARRGLFSFGAGLRPDEGDSARRDAGAWARAAFQRTRRWRQLPEIWNGPSGSSAGGGPKALRRRLGRRRSGELRNPDNGRRRKPEGGNSARAITGTTTGQWRTQLRQARRCPWMRRTPATG